MNKTRVLNVTAQSRLSRVGARFLFSLVATCAAVLLKASLVHAATVAPVADVAGKPVVAAVSATNERFLRR